MNDPTVRLINSVWTPVTQLLGIFVVAWLRLRWLVFGAPRILAYPHPINAMVLRHFGAKVGKNTRLHGPFTLHAAEFHYKNLSVADGCLFNGNNLLDLSGKIILERGVSLGPGVIINTHNSFNHNDFLETALASQCDVRDVVIKEGAGIKAAAVIIYGVTIGRDAVVAAGAIVTKDVPDRTFVVGAPAKPKMKINLPGEEG